MTLAVKQPNPSHVRLLVLTPEAGSITPGHLLGMLAGVGLAANCHRQR